MNKVAVIVRTFNSEKTIERCLDSIENQTLTDKIAIVVDDESTDRTVEIASKYFCTDIHTHKWLGPAGNLSYAKNYIADSEYVMIVDSDDYLAKNDAIETLYNLAKSEESEFIYCEHSQNHCFMKAKLFCDTHIGNFRCNEFDYIDYIKIKAKNPIQLTYDYYCAAQGTGTYSSNIMLAPIYLHEWPIKILFDNIFYFINIYGPIKDRKKYAFSDRFDGHNIYTLYQTLLKYHYYIPTYLEKEWKMINDFFTNEYVPKDDEDKDYNPYIDIQLNEKINVFVVTLKGNTERIEHLKKEFTKSNIFNLVIGEFTKNELPARGLWNNFVKATYAAKLNNLPFFVFCEDDHTFTDKYDDQTFVNHVYTAIANNAIVNCGFIKPVNEPAEYFIPINETYVQLIRFYSTQLLIIPAGAYDYILNFEYNFTRVAKQDNFTLDGILSNYHTVLAPRVFLSYQGFFDSDITHDNNYSKQHYINTEKELNA